MKKYIGIRKYDDICNIMKEKGMEIDNADFEKGSDFVYFKGAWHDLPLTVMFNTFNGQFSVFNGFTGKLLATHLSTELDMESWYADLMDTLYLPLVKS